MAQTNLRNKKRRETKNRPILQENPLPANGKPAVHGDFHNQQEGTGTVPPVQQVPVIVKIEDKKKYLLESVLIVFSVLLALSLNELRAYWQEKKQTRELLTNIKAEFIRNKELALFQHGYHQLVLKNIDSALTYPAYREQIFAGDDYNIGLLTPEGIMARGAFEETAWNVAKSNNIISKVDLKLISQITDIYFQQHMISIGFDGIKELFISRESQKMENGEQTLKLMKKIYRGYITDRTPYLVRDYNQVIKHLDNQLNTSFIWWFNYYFFIVE